VIPLAAQSSAVTQQKAGFGRVQAITFTAPKTPNKSHRHLHIMHLLVVAMMPADLLGWNMMGLGRTRRTSGFGMTGPFDQAPLALLK
jgi:hypothetical protein